MADPLVAIVVLNWNRWEETLACVDSLDRLDYDRRLVLVVDNASSDGSEDRIREARPDVELIQSGHNLGYAGGNNVGIREALDRGADAVWILNNDTEVDPGALTALVDAAAAPDWGILAACLVDPAGEILGSAGVEVDGEVTPLLCSGCDAGFHAADVVMGASLFVRADVFKDIGLLDEHYFHYFEERDFVERARRRGWTLGLACGSHVRHEEGATLGVRSPQATYYFVRNHIFYERRFSGQHPVRVLTSGAITLRRHLALRHAVRSRDFRGVAATALGVGDALRDRSGPRDLGRRFGRPLRWA
jgi:GT2 family glycosyltransferase